jgi:nucleoside-diphosphate-sugar epimerase
MNDMVDLYLTMLEAPAAKIAGQAFNAGYENLSIRDVATAVRDVVAQELPGRAPIAIETAPSNDPRSYHVNSEKLGRTLGFRPRRSVRDGARDVAAALREGALPGALSDERYYNVKMLKALQVR